MRLLELPNRFSEALDIFTRSVCEIRTSLHAVLLPLTILLCLCLLVVGFEICSGESSLTHTTFVHRTVTGAIDQLWYVTFYFSLPFTCHLCKTNIERIRNSKDWILVDDQYELDDEWVIVENPSIINKLKS